MNTKNTKTNEESKLVVSMRKNMRLLAKFDLTYFGQDAHRVREKLEELSSLCQIFIDFEKGLYPLDEEPIDMGI